MLRSFVKRSASVFARQPKVNVMGGCRLGDNGNDMEAAKVIGEAGIDESLASFTV